MGMGPRSEYLCAALCQEKQDGTNEKNRQEARERFLSDPGYVASVSTVWRTTRWELEAHQRVLRRGKHGTVYRKDVYTHEPVPQIRGFWFLFIYIYPAGRTYIWPSR